MRSTQRSWQHDYTTRIDTMRHGKFGIERTLRRWNRVRICNAMRAVAYWWCYNRDWSSTLSCAHCDRWVVCGCVLWRIIRESSLRPSCLRRHHRHAIVTADIVRAVVGVLEQMVLQIALQIECPIALVALERTLICVRPSMGR